MKRTRLAAVGACRRQLELRGAAAAVAVAAGHRRAVLAEGHFAVQAISAEVHQLPSSLKHPALQLEVPARTSEIKSSLGMRDRKG